MDAIFPKRLSSLRRERKLSQRTAAAALNISQALLSHYENGMREPGLDFIRTACAYYGVSSDYLLGISPVRSAVVYGSSDALAPGAMDALFRSAAELFRGLDASGCDDACKCTGSMLTLFLYGMMSRYDASLHGDMLPSVCFAAVQMYQARMAQALHSHVEDGGADLELDIPAGLKKAAQAELDIFDDYWR